MSWQIDFVIYFQDLDGTNRDRIFTEIISKAGDLIAADDLFRLGDTKTEPDRLTLRVESDHTEQAIGRAALTQLVVKATADVKPYLAWFSVPAGGGA